MLSYHPLKEGTWVKPEQSVYKFGESFYKSSGGIFAKIPHYEQKLKGLIK